MVERAYTPQDLRVQDTRGLRETKVAKPDTTPAYTVEVGNKEWLDDLLNGLGKTVGKALMDRADYAKQEAYLEGAAKAGQIESEEELDASPLTKDWMIAGYRDTMGRLALTEAEAQFQADLSDPQGIRTQSPEEFSKYLAKRRATLRPALNSMSRGARSELMGKMVLQDDAARHAHTAEHIKYITEMTVSGMNTAHNVSLNALNAAKQAGQGPEAIRAATDSFVGNLAGTVLLNDQLPLNIKQEFMVAALKNAMDDGDNIQVYERAQELEMPGGGTLLDRLTPDQRTSLANKARETSGRLVGQRTFELRTQFDQMQQALADGERIDATFEQYNAKLYEYRAAGVISDSEVSTARKLFLKNKRKTDLVNYGAEALELGDQAGVARSGNSPKELITAKQDQWNAAGVPQAQQLSRLFDLGEKWKEGLDAAGALADQHIFPLMGSTENVPEESKALILSLMQRTQNTTGVEGRELTEARMLSGMAPETRLFYMRVQDQMMNKGQTFESAIMFARDRYVKTQGLSKSQLAGIGASQKEMNAAVNRMTSHGKFSRFFLHLGSLFSKDYRNRLELEPTSDMNARDGFVGDSAAVQKSVQMQQTELAYTMARMRDLDPYAPADTLLEAAQSDMINRTVQVYGKPVTLPYGVTLQAAFGTTQNAAGIGQAIESLVKPTKPTSSLVVMYHQGQLRVEEYEKNGGQTIAEYQFSPEEVRAKVLEGEQARDTRVDQILGGGVDEFLQVPKGINVVPNPQPRTGQTQKAPAKSTATHGKLKVNFNGENTVGVAPHWMFDFRKGLVGSEGLSLKVYDDIGEQKHKDGSRVQTTGVGVSTTNTYYPKPDKNGNITQAQMEESFLLASNAAAKVGDRIANQVGRYNQAGFMLFSELAYQSGDAFATRKDSVGDEYRAFLDEMGMGTVESAQAAFKKTAAWRFSRDRKNPGKIAPRQKKYLKLIQDSFRKFNQ